MRKRKRFLGGVLAAVLALGLSAVNVFAAMINNGVLNGTGTWGMDIENSSTGVIVAGNYTKTVYNHGLILGGNFHQIVDEGDGRYGLSTVLTGLTAKPSGETYSYGGKEYFVMPYGEEYVLTLDQEEGYTLPASIRILQGETELVSGSDYTYSRETGTVAISGTAVKAPLILEAAGIDVNAVARIGSETYDSLREAFSAAADMEEYGGTTVSADNPVVIEVLKDLTLDREILVSEEYHIRLTSGEGGPYTITRDAEKATDYMIEMPQQFRGTLILDHIILDGGATETSPETDGVLVVYGNAVLDSGAVIQNNKGRSNGSAVNVQKGTFTMNEGSVIQNNTVSGSGGAVMTWAEFVMNGGTIRENSTLGNYTYGGGVNVQFTAGASFTMYGGTITDNSAYRNGGGVYFSNSGGNANVFLYGGTITGNTASGSEPEDIYAQNGATLVLSGSAEIGYLNFSSAACKILVSEPLKNSVFLGYELNPQNGSVIIEKGETYGEGNLDTSKFVLTGWDSRCLWLGEDGSEITINVHSGGTDTCLEGAVCENCGKEYGEPTGHSWGEPEWNWSEDKTQAEVTFTCQNDSSHKVSPEVTVSSQRTEATCTEAGKIVYTAEAVFGEETYTDVQTVEIPAAGHSYKDGKCQICGEKDPDYQGIPSKPEKPELTVKPGDSTSAVSEGKLEAAATWDCSSISQWIVLLAAAGLGIAAGIWGLAKNREKNY